MDSGYTNVSSPICLKYFINIIKLNKNQYEEGPLGILQKEPVQRANKQNSKTTLISKAQQLSGVSKSHLQSEHWTEMSAQWYRGVNIDIIVQAQWVCCKVQSNSIQTCTVQLWQFFWVGYRHAPYKRAFNGKIRSATCSGVSKTRAFLQPF